MHAIAAACVCRLLSNWFYDGIALAVTCDGTASVCSRSFRDAIPNPQQQPTVRGL